MKTYPLGKVASIVRDAIGPDEIKDGTLYVGLENLTENGSFEGVEAVRRGELASTKFEFTEKHILYGKLRPYLKKIASPDFQGICSTDILPILPGRDLNRRYLYHFLRIDRMVELASSRATGANLPRLSQRVLETFEIPLPSFPEQQRIAEILDKTEALRAKRRAALFQIDVLSQALFHDFFNNTKIDISECSMVDVAEPNRGSFVNGPFGSDLLTSELQDNGVPVIYIRDIREGEYRRVSKVFISERKAHDLDVCKVQPGDVLIAKVGDPPGIAAIYPENEPTAVVTQDVIRIRLNTDVALPEYIVSYLNSSIGRWKISGITIEATRARFSLGDLKRLKIQVPPIHFQQKFTHRISALEKLKTTYRNSLAEMDSLFASLQHRAFKGEL